MPGSKKGRTFSPEARQRMAEAARNRKYKPGVKEKLAEQIKAQRADPDFEAKRVAALQKALTGTTCLEECECEKHSIQSRQRISEARSGTVQSEETKAKIGAGSKDMWANMSVEKKAEVRQKKSEAAKATWKKEKAAGVHRPVGNRRVSNHELALVPYMKELGFQHNRKMMIGRKVPDFVNEPSKTVYEYFGSYWHPDRDEEFRIKDYYAVRGWTCHVLWEDDLFPWLQARAHLVTDEEHEHAWKIAHVNNGFKKPV